MANRGEPWRTVAVRAPHEPNRGVAVRFVGRTEPWGLRTVRFVSEPHRAVRGSNRGQHYPQYNRWTSSPGRGGGGTAEVDGPQRAVSMAKNMEMTDWSAMTNHTTPHPYLIGGTTVERHRGQ